MNDRFLPAQRRKGESRLVARQVPTLFGEFDNRGNNARSRGFNPAPTGKGEATQDAAMKTSRRRTQAVRTYNPLPPGSTGRLTTTAASWNFPCAFDSDGRRALFNSLFRVPSRTTRSPDGMVRQLAPARSGTWGEPCSPTARTLSGDARPGHHLLRAQPDDARRDPRRPGRLALHRLPNDHTN
jgi:hypothetical protein